MGWFSRKIKDPVDGTLHVVAVTQPPSHGRKVSLEMDVVVSVPGHESYADKWSHLVSIDKVPQPGSVLPIEASSSDPKRYEILWDQVPSNDDAAAAAAQRLADSMNAGRQPGPPMAHPLARPPIPTQRSRSELRPCSPEKPPRTCCAPFSARPARHDGVRCGRLSQRDSSAVGQHQWPPRPTG